LNLQKRYWELFLGQPTKLNDASKEALLQRDRKTKMNRILRIEIEESDLPKTYMKVGHHPERPAEPFEIAELLLTAYGEYSCPVNYYMSYWIEKEQLNEE
jgi:hypothetical protein